MNTFGGDTGREERKRKVAKMSYTPNMSADQIILNSFAGKDKNANGPLFPMLHRPVSRQKQYTYAQSQKEKGVPVGRLGMSGSTQGTANVPRPPSAPKPPMKKIELKVGYFPNPDDGVPQPPMVSPRQEEYSKRRTKKDMIEAHIKPTPNLKPVFDILSTYMNDEGNLKEDGFRAAMNELELIFTPPVRQEIPNRTNPKEPILSEEEQARKEAEEIKELDFVFQLYTTFKGFRNNRMGAPEMHVRVTDLMVAFDFIVNGYEKDWVRKACFDLFDHDEPKRGCIHKSYLNQLKVQKKFDDGDQMRTGYMVKILNDLFKEEYVIEETAFLEEGKGKKKKKKKSKPPVLKPLQKSAIPVERMRVSHIDFPRFNTYFDEHRELATAFFPVWVMLFLNDQKFVASVKNEVLNKADAPVEDEANAADGN